MSVIIESRGVTKKYKDKWAVKSLDFQINSGESVGVLGPNGAGKTSLMRMMYCSSPVTEGELYVLGTNVKDNPMGVKSQIGVVPQEDGLDPDFSVVQNLDVYAKFFRVPQSRVRAKNLLREFFLDDYENASVKELSGGMKRRLVIARALIHEPRILFLDEPTTGLDPQARHWIWEKLLDLKRKGVTLVITTHYMEEAAKLCDRVILINQGRIVDEGKPQDLVAENIGSEVVEFILSTAELDYYKNKISKKYPHQILGNRLKVFIQPGGNSKEVLELISSDHINVRRANLEDVFLKITGFDLGRV